MPAVDEVARLVSQIERTRAAGTEAYTELDRLQTERLAAGSFDQAETLDRQIRAAQWEIDRAAAELPGLEAELDAARAEKRRAALIYHRRRIAAIYPRLKSAIEAAADVQVEAIAAREAAARDCGEQLVQLAVPALAYRGFLLPDLVKLWVSEQERVWAAPWSPPVPQPVAPPRPLPSAKERDLTRRQPSGLGHDQPKIGGTVPPRSPSASSAARERGEGISLPPAAPPSVPREPRKDPAPPAPGERRIRFVRSGTPIGGNDGPLSVLGDEVNVPAGMAQILVLKSTAAIYVDLDEEEAK